MDIINWNFKDSTTTLRITGLPVVITGKVITIPSTGIIALRLNSRKIYSAKNLIAFLY